MIVGALTPALAQRFEPGCLQVLRCHRWQELDLRVEVKEPGFGVLGDLRRVFHVDDQVAAPGSTPCGEIGRFGVAIVEDAQEAPPDNRAKGTAQPRALDAGAELHLDAAFPKPLNLLEAAE